MPEPIHPYPPEFERQVRNALAQPEPDPAFMDSLRGQFLARASRTQKETGKMKANPLRLSARLVWGLGLLVLLALILAAFSSPDVVNAMRRLLGYIPGIGIVEQDAALRVLARPVTQTRDGVLLTVEQASLQADKTVIVYRYVLDTTTLERLPSSDAGRQPSFTADPTLRLPDGSQQKIIRGIHEPGDLSDAERAAGKSAIRYRMEFNALPANVNHVVLLLPRLVPLAPGAGPEFWEIPLDFKPSAGSVQPVIEVAASQTPALTALPVTPLPNAQPDPGIALVLEKVVPQDDGYIFMGTFQSRNPADFAQSDTPGSGDPQDMRPTLQSFSLALTDADGLVIPAEQTDAAQQAWPYWRSWSLRVKGRDFHWPVTITTHQMQADIPAQASFQFDPGAHPQPGQVWEINQDIQAAGHVVHVRSAQGLGDAGGSVNGFRFSLESGDGVFDAILADLDHPQQVSGVGAGSESLPGPFDVNLSYTDPLPSGPIRVGIEQLSLAFYGTWQASWAPAGEVPGPLPTPVARPGTALRVLAQPVTLKARDGVTLTLEQVVADDRQTMFVFQYVLDAGYVPLVPGPADRNPLEPILRLPDGSQPKLLAGGPFTLYGDAPDDPGLSSFITSYVVFGPLPHSMDHALLVLPQLPGSDPGTVPGNWEIPFNLQPVSAPASTPSASTPLGQVSDRGIDLLLEQVTPLADGYRFDGSVRVSYPALTDAGIFAPLVRVVDAGGNELPFEQLTPSGQNLPGRQLWSLRVSGTDLRWPISIRVAGMQAQLPASADFLFDAGPAPVPGQGWTVDRVLQVGGYPVRIIGIRLSAALDGSGFAQYQVFMRSTPDLLGVSVIDLDHPAGLGMGGGEPGPGLFSTGLFYNGDVPAGVLHVGIRMLYVLAHGSWQLNWSPPAH